MRRISDFLCRPLVIRSWNAASLFGSEVRDVIALRRHRLKLRSLARLVDGAHAVAPQETRGTAADLLQLQDLFPGWEFHEAFAAQGTSGGTMVMISPAIVAAYPERRFYAVVPSRAGICDAPRWPRAAP